MIRLGTTSYILPDNIIPNVRYLAPMVDDIELVLFESKEESNLPSPGDIRTLVQLSRDYNLTYTVHFPLDVYPGSFDAKVRQTTLETYLKIIRLTESLGSFAYVFHLTPESFGLRASVDERHWLECTEQTLSCLLERTGLAPSLFCAETLSYPFSLVLPLVRKLGLGVTLDIGHVWNMGFDENQAQSSLLPLARICHLHGVQGRIDHQSLVKGDPALVAGFLSALERQYALDGKDRVLTLEVFTQDDFLTSLSLLQEHYQAILHLR
ncbi:MAG: cobamide remodeling phosphodiesterase CbiR [Sphaerochaetaceae bacterium]